MSSIPATTKLYESPKKEINERKFGIKDTPQCICCMRPISQTTPEIWVHMNTDWLAVRPDIDEEHCAEYTGADSQGCFQVGPDCAKKMKGFTFKLDQQA